MTAKNLAKIGAPLPIAALVAMADPACRDQFAGELKHMVMDMRNTEFVKAKQSALVLASYVPDRRTPKTKKSCTRYVEYGCCSRKTTKYRATRRVI